MESPESLSLGEPMPAGDPHAVSVCLPTWSDTLGWASREPRILKALVTGYPRFFMPRLVQTLGTELARRFYAQFGIPVESKCILPLASRRHANQYRLFVYGRLCLEPGQDAAQALVDLLQVRWNGSISRLETADEEPNAACALPGQEDIYLVCCPADLFAVAKAFWQHTGFGISSRRAAMWLQNAPFLDGVWVQQSTLPKALDPLVLGSRWDFANAELRNRICEGRTAKPEDVFLYATGMSAITEVGAAIQELRISNPTDSCVAAVFGFVYVDTYKVVSLILGYETTLYKYADSDIDSLEQKLEVGQRLDVCFTEFPGNPLLQTPNLPRLYALSRKYDFVMVVDDTLSTFANVELLSSCDVLCTSLTKMFSGACNVMGGSAVISRDSPYCERMRRALESRNENHVWFPEDVLVMEHNSRDFVSRARRASANALALVEQLRGHPSVAEVYYPEKSPTQWIYDQYKLPGGGYGFLVSVRFTSPATAIRFYDALETAKGPSLGTNFTLACAYTLLAHYSELDWAASFGVVEDLVRISVGLEDEEWLRTRVEKALQAAANF
ncbi:putative cystathionine gamma-synthase [Echria macrotheca]|uniref:Cystathionine gamma-synthase n=1 Tax=Echria macrotheca TaxID=438768 RepID=A0AAJ0B721_9PEZI|nr:putative cystathionine gamma-synthase [Echria macrotheca]